MLGDVKDFPKRKVEVDLKRIFNPPAHSSIFIKIKLFRDKSWDVKGYV